MRCAWEHNVGVVLILLLAAGCDGQSASSQPHDPRGTSTPLSSVKPLGGPPIRVVCTTGMVADLVRNVGGPHVEVTQLMGEGVDPHRFQATPGDISRIQEADAVFYSGLHLEGKLVDVLASRVEIQPVFAVTATMPIERLLEAEEGLYDPHVWFDVELWSLATERVAEVLAALDPPRAEEYAANTRAYRERLDGLHAEVKEAVASIPERQRVLVTAHDAFHYFGRAYGLEVKAIQGVSTDSEAGLKTINDLVDFLVERKIKAVFVETSVPERAVKSLVDGAAQAGHEVRIGGELFSDAMGAEGTPEGTYEGMIRHNVETIVEALK